MADVLHKTTFRFMKSVNTADYLDGNWLINPDMSAIEGVPQKYWKVVGETVVPMSDEEIALVEAEELENYKQAAMNRIDAKTEEILARGFQFDGQMFSLSIAAQNNWTGMQVAVSQGYLTEANFPFEVATLDNKAYLLQWEDAPAFFMSVLRAISFTLATGRQFKKAIGAANTIQDIENVEDTRQ
jgi:hypothetical protein